MWNHNYVTDIDVPTLRWFDICTRHQASYLLVEDSLLSLVLVYCQHGFRPGLS
jgi:hypothetical protein